MDLQITVKTPGDKLSMRTMLGGIIKDLQRDLDLGTFDMLKSEFPSASNETLKKLVSKKSELYLSDIRRGSWEIVLVSGLGGIIGKAIYDLSIDYIKSSTGWVDFKNRTKKPSKVAAENVLQRIEKRKKLGPFIIHKKKTTLIESANGIAKLTVELELKRKNDTDIDIDPNIKFEVQHS